MNKINKCLVAAIYIGPSNETNNLFYGCNGTLDYSSFIMDDNTIFHPYGRNDKFYIPKDYLYIPTDQPFFD